MFKRTIFLNITAYLLMGLFAPVFALDSPTFPVCSNAQGSVRVSYSTGTHGVAGKSETYTGSDTVYQMNSDTLVQCFCPESGSGGIQTDWWKVSHLSEEEIQDLINDGWIYIPNGALWGLSEDPYLAQNINYDCKPSTGTGGGGSGGVSGAGVSSAGQVLGLAATGNITTILALIFAGLMSLAFGVYLRNKSS